MRSDGEALLRVADRRHERGGERQGAEVAKDAREPLDLARHGDRQAAAQREARDHLAVAQVHVRPGGSRCGLAEIDHVILACLAVVDHSEAAAADAARGRVHDAGGKNRRDGGVDGVAAVLEYLDACLGGELVLCGNHAARRRRREQRLRQDEQQQRERSNQQVHGSPLAKRRLRAL